MLLPMSTGNRADDEHEDMRIGCNLLACTQLLLQQSLIAAYMPILNSPAEVCHPKGQQCGPTHRPVHQRASILSTDKWTHSLHIPTKYVTHPISDNFWISLKLLNQYSTRAVVTHQQASSLLLDGHLKLLAK